MTLTLEILNDIADTAQWTFEGAEEIGTSDVSCVITSVLRQHGLPTDDLSDIWRELCRNAVNEGIWRNSPDED